MDQHWWQRLFAETPRQKGIRLTSHASLLRHGGIAMQEILDTTPSGHRAGEDAVRLMQALARGLKLSPGIVPLVGDRTPVRPKTDSGS